MEKSQREKPATVGRLGQVFREQNFSPKLWELALESAGFKPNKADWQRFLDLLMLAMGTIFLLAGILFFFAFNWADMGKWTRFAVVELAVVIATVLAFIFKLDTWAGRMALAGAAILLGIALAVIGQVYQTGADNWQLFQTWAMLLTAWVLISRWNIMWLIWMVLINLTIGLYWQQVLMDNWQFFNLLILLINLGFVVAWDLLARFSKFEFVKQGRWFLYIFAAVALAHISYLMIDYIFGFYISPLIPFAPFIYGAVLGLMLLLYTLIYRDLLMLTLSAFSFLVVSITWLGEFIYEAMMIQTNYLAFYLYYFIMGIITVGMTVILVLALRRLQKAWEA